MDMLTLMLVILIPAFAMALLYEWWLNKSKIKQKENRKLDKQQLDEIKQLLREHKSITKIKKKIQGWKQEGYSVDELEEMVEEYKLLK